MPTQYEQLDEELVRDTLYCRRRDNVGCIMHNLASDDLDAAGPTVLPVIEHVVVTDVEGRCTVFEDKRYEDFPGLLSVMRSYFNISDRFSLHANAVRFLCRISFGTRLDALDALHRLIYWDQPMPNEIQRALDDILPRITAPERVIINGILERHRKRRWWQSRKATH